MTTETFIVTAVPPPGAGAGVAGQPYSLAACISVRLAPEEDGTPLTALAFPAFGAWPQHAPSFAVSVNGADPIAATARGGVDPSAWSLVAGLPVHGFDHLVAAQSSAALVQGADAVNTGPLWKLTQPVFEHLAAGDIPVSLPLPDPSTLIPRRARALTPVSVHPTPAPTGRPAPPRPAPVTGPHLNRRLAMFTDFPQVLRLLGLTWDLTFPWPETMLGSSVDLRIAMTLPVAATIVTPTTRVPTAANPADAYENDNELSIVPIDVAHAAWQFAEQRRVGRTPALRSPGLALVRAAGQQPYLAARTSRRVAVEQQLAAASVPSLEGDDLLLGHRIDVADQADGVWRSLCARTYTVERRAGLSTNQVLGATTDEAVVSSSVADDAAGRATVSDVLTRWSGWSLAVPKPGHPSNGRETITLDGIVLPAAVPPGTLPTLRYGHTYAVRARRVHLDGTSVDVSTASAPILRQSFARTEPVAAPEVVAANALGPGASVSQLVVRSSDLPLRAAPERRWLLPPAVSVDVAERHGMFDTSAGSPDPSSWTTIAAHEGSLWSQPPPQPAPISFPPEHGRQPQKSDVIAATVWSGPSAPAVPYLPDPVATGAVFTVVDGADALGVAAGATLEASFALSGVIALPGAGPRWPDTVGAIAVELAATMDAVGGWVWDASSRTVRLTLPPGRTVSLDVAAAVDPARLGELALSAWTTVGATSAWQARARQASIKALSTPRRLVATHATMRPVTAPTIADVTLVRDPGSTDGTVALHVTVEPYSTHQFDVYAQVTDWIDGGPGTAAPVAAQRTLHLATVPVAGGGTFGLAGIDLPFDDTAAHTVQLDVVATSAFPECFPDATTDELQRSASAPPLAVPASAAPKAPAIESVVPTYGWTRLDLGYSGQHTSDAGGLRIYLRRPAGASGPGERVVVHTADCVIGTDPLVHGQPQATSLSAQNFPYGTPYGDGDVSFPLDFDPDFPGDEGRYSVDVIFTPPAVGYRPFVDVSIALLQPDAQQDCATSTAVRTGPCQLPPAGRFSASAGNGAAGPEVTFDVSVDFAEAAQDPSLGRVGLYSGWTVTCDEALFVTTSGAQGPLTDLDQATGVAWPVCSPTDQPETVSTLTLRLELNEFYVADDWSNQISTPLRTVYTDTIVLTLTPPITLPPRVKPPPIH